MWRKRWDVPCCVPIPASSDLGFTIKDAEERAIRMNAALYQYLVQLRRHRTDTERLPGP